MAGLLQPQQPQRQPGGQPAPGPAPAGAQQPSPEAQQGQPGAQPGMEAMAGDEGADESHPAFQQAMDFMMQTLYEKGASENIHKALTKTQNPVQEMANIAYEITSIVDEKTEGQVPDELLMLMASNALKEVHDIAEASGVQLEPADIGNAFKTMVLRYVGEQGYDTRELEQAMNQVQPEQINELVAQVDAGMGGQQGQPQGANPQQGQPPGRAQQQGPQPAGRAGQRPMGAA